MFNSILLLLFIKYYYILLLFITYYYLNICNSQVYEYFSKIVKQRELENCMLQRISTKDGNCTRNLRSIRRQFKVLRHLIDHVIVVNCRRAACPRIDCQSRVVHRHLYYLRRREWTCSHNQRFIKLDCSCCSNASCSQILLDIAWICFWSDISTRNEIIEMKSPSIWKLK